MDITSLSSSGPMNQKLLYRSVHPQSPSRLHHLRSISSVQCQYLMTTLGECLFNLRTILITPFFRQKLLLTVTVNDWGNQPTNHQSCCLSQQPSIVLSVRGPAAAASASAILGKRAAAKIFLPSTNTEIKVPSTLYIKVMSKIENECESNAPRRPSFRDFVLHMTIH